MTFRELSSLYLKSPECSLLSFNTQRNYLSKTKALQSMQGKWRKIMNLEVSNSTKNTYLSVLRTIYQWGQEQGLVYDYPILPKKPLKVTHKDREIYTKEEVGVIYQAAQTTEERIYSNFLKMCFFTGCRPSELYSLTWANVKDQYLEFIGTKRNEPGQIGRKCLIIQPITECLEVARWVWSQIVPEYTPKPSDCVFRSAQAPNLHPGYTRTAIKNLARIAGIGQKQLRHTRAGLATAMLKGGYSIYDIQGQLGHSSVATTERYLRPSLEDRANSYRGV